MSQSAAQPLDGLPIFVRAEAPAKFLLADQERDLIEKWRTKGDSAAGDRIIRSFVPLVRKHAAKFRKYGLPMEDLIQEANIALLEAAKRFDLSRGFRFATYAVWWIKAALQEFVLRNWSIVRMGSTREQKSLFFKLRYIQAQIGQRDQTSTSSSSDVATALGVPQSHVEQMDVRLRKGDLQINAPFPGGEDEVGAFLPDRRPDPEAAFADKEYREVRARYLSDALDRLDERERRIISARQLAEKPTRLRLLGLELGVSTERVRQIEQRAMEKLRKALKEQVSMLHDLLPSTPQTYSNRWSG